MPSVPQLGFALLPVRRMICCHARVKGLLPLFRPHHLMLKASNGRTSADACWVVAGATHEGEINVWDYRRESPRETCELADRFQSITLIGGHS